MDESVLFLFKVIIGLLGIITSLILYVYHSNRKNVEQHYSDLKIDTQRQFAEAKAFNEQLWKNHSKDHEQLQKAISKTTDRQDICRKEFATKEGLGRLFDSVHQIDGRVEELSAQLMSLSTQIASISGKLSK